MMEKSFLKPAEETGLSDITENYKRICDNINKAIAKRNRKDKVQIMAVTKTVCEEKINHAVSLGATLLGENRVQEFLGKYENYSKNSEIHFIGGLQNNKVKYIIDKVSMIHSVNSIKLAEEISKRAINADLVMDILFEINIAEENSKSGVDKDGLDLLVENCLLLPNIRIRGLMAIPPKGTNEKYFAQMQEIFLTMQEKLKNQKNSQFDTLSMGMSNDYEQAVLYGSTIVRIGSSLFGYRNYN